MQIKKQKQEKKLKHLLDLKFNLKNKKESMIKQRHDDKSPSNMKVQIIKKLSEAYSGITLKDIIGQTSRKEGASPTVLVH